MFAASVLLLCVQDGYVTFVSEVTGKGNEQHFPTGSAAVSEACI